MTLRQSFLLVLLAATISLPFTLSACGKKNASSNAGEEAKNASKPDDSSGKKTEDTKEKASSSDFRLPDDQGGKLLSRVLPPPERLPDLEKRTPRTRPAPQSLDNPKLPLTPQVASLPRLLDAGPLRTPLPKLLSPEPLFGLEESFGSLPQALSFPAQDRARVPSVDVTKPVLLPRSAQPLLDKAATTDPTLDASKTAVLIAPLPVRDAPVPFQRFTLPDPFENSDTVRLKTMPGEEHLPDGTIRPPR